MINTFYMDIKSLDEVIVKKPYLNRTVTICFTEPEECRWCDLRDRLKEISLRTTGKYQDMGIQKYGRAALKQMMDAIETLIIEREKDLDIIVHKKTGS